jgi:hypothetical protein
LSLEYAPTTLKLPYSIIEVLDFKGLQFILSM